MRTLAGLAALALAIAAPAPAHAVGEFSQDGWAGKAVIEGGTFKQCNMWLSAINNYDLGLSLDTGGELRLGIRSDQMADMSWTMIFDQRTGLRIQIDDGPVLIRSFKTINPHLLSTSLKDTDWEKRLPNGKLLRINTGRVKLFHLNGIKEAMGKLRACVAKYKAA